MYTRLGARGRIGNGFAERGPNAFADDRKREPIGRCAGCGADLYRPEEVSGSTSNRQPMCETCAVGMDYLRRPVRLRGLS